MYMYVETSKVPSAAMSFIFSVALTDSEFNLQMPRLASSRAIENSILTSHTGFLEDMHI